jgi:hypothetical protein
MKLGKLKSIGLWYFLIVSSWLVFVVQGRYIQTITHFIGVINGNMTVSPAVIKANGLYSFTIDSSTRIPAGGYFTLTFPPEVTLSQKP